MNDFLQQGALPHRLPLLLTARNWPAPNRHRNLRTLSNPGQLSLSVLCMSLYRVQQQH